MPGVNNSGEFEYQRLGRPRSEVVIDGASLTIPESGGTVFNFPGIEAFKEIRLITSTYNAEYGRMGGAWKPWSASPAPTNLMAPRS